MRRQRPRGATRREAVIDAALKVVDEVGVEGLTIRAVAGQVGVPPMSLYTHFVNKDGLLELMYEEMSRRLYRDSGQASWQAELAALTGHVRSTLLAHPHWCRILTRLSAPPDIPVRERMLSLMTAGGIPAEHALNCLTSALLTTVGLTYLELSFREAERHSTIVRRFYAEDAAANEAAPQSRGPSQLDAARFDLEGAFRLAVAALIDGFAAGHPPRDAE